MGQHERNSPLKTLSLKPWQKTWIHIQAVTKRLGLSEFVVCFLMVALTLLMVRHVERSQKKIDIKIGDVSARTLRVHKDMEVVDVEGTEHERSRLIAQSPEIYEHDSLLHINTKKKWVKSIAEGRKAFVKNKGVFQRHKRMSIEDLSRLLDVELSPEEFSVFERLEYSRGLERAYDSTFKILEGRLITENKVARRDFELIDKKNKQKKLVRASDFSLLRMLSVDEARMMLEALSLNLGPRANPEDTFVMRGVLKKMISANLKMDVQATEDSRESQLAKLQPKVLRIFRGEVVVREGERVTSRALNILKQLEAKVGEGFSFLRFLSESLFGSFILWLLVLFIRKQYPKVLQHKKDSTVAAIFLLASIAVTKLFFALHLEILAPYFAPEVPKLFFLLILPHAAPAMIIRLLQGTNLSFFVAALFGFSTAILMEKGMLFGLFVFAVGLSGSMLLNRIRTRTELFKSGLGVALFSGVAAVTLLLAWGFQFPLSEESTAHEPWKMIVWSFAGGLIGGWLSSAMTLVVTPILEGMLDYTTDLKLIELSRMDHPLLKELVMKAPGTYHHSIVVGSLVEAGADVIGANSLLGRVGSYYHDIGKIPRAEYFVENQSNGVSRHEQMTPQLSAKIIISHVKEGVVMAQKHGLGQKMVDFIEQHHGKSIVSYFYNKAKQLAAIPNEAGEVHNDVDEAEFRYPGPSPQTKEAAIMSLADACEAATRSLVDPTPARIEGMVKKIFSKSLAEGLLDESDITLRELKLVEHSFLRVLLGIYHNRIQYPDQEKGLPSRTTNSIVPIKKTS